jgi:hypothetical protein
MVPLDILQNHLSLISSHISDATEALENGDDSIIEANLTDIGEIVEELQDYLPKNLAAEIEAKEMGMDSMVEEIADDM